MCLRSKNFQQFCQLFRHLTTNIYSLAGLGMGEYEMCRMQEEAAEVFDSLLNLHIRDRIVAAFVINRIADDWMIDRGEVYADLVGASCLDIDIEERKLFKSLADLPKRESLPAVRSDGHLRAMPAVARDGPIDRAGILTRVAMHKGDIRLLHFPITKRRRQCFLSLNILCDNDQPRSVFVEPMYDADPFRTGCVSGR